MHFAEQEELNGLLHRTAQGDRAAFAELYRRTAPRLLGLCLRLLRDRADADEVLQEAFVNVWRRAASFDPSRAGAIPWLIALTRNRAIDRLRQRRRSALASESFDDTTMDQQPTAPAELDRSQQYRQLRRCLEQLDPQHQRSVHEAFFTGATYAELAARLQVPLGTMKSWIRRSLQQLRKCLEQ